MPFGVWQVDLLDTKRDMVKVRGYKTKYDFKII